jgi:hypothetical protein
MFNNTKKTKKRLTDAYGKIKTDSFNFDLIEKYFRKIRHSDESQSLTDKTCKDLDFNELFMFVDRTTSKIGQQYLYNKLRTIPLHRYSEELQERLVEKIGSDSALRLKIQLVLDKLTSSYSYYVASLFQDEQLKEPVWFFLVRILSFTAIFSILMLPFIPQALFILLPVVITNMVIHFWNKRNIVEYVASVPQLLKLNDTAKELLKLDIFRSGKETIYDSIKCIDKVRNKMQYFKLEAKLESDMEMAVWALMELIKSVFLIEPLFLFSALKQLETKRKEIEDVFCFVGMVDSLVSIASLRNGLTVWCKPEIDSSKKVFNVTEVYHPMIVDCVPNSINTDGKSILITGSNMSGKTSFIRTIALNTITAQTLNTCFAEKFCMSNFMIYSAIRISDDLMNDKSYYFEEVLTIKDMIGNSRKDVANMFLLDEIFKGTNTVERISAGKAVLSYLDTDNNIVLVSTHDIELADMLRDSYQLYHFSEKVDNNTVDFDYKIKPGKLRNRNAIKILEINNYPSEIINEAIEISKTLDKKSPGSNIHNN